MTIVHEIGLFKVLSPFEKVRVNLWLGLPGKTLKEPPNERQSTTAVPADKNQRPTL